VETRSRRPWAFGIGSKPWETLVADVRDFGWSRVRTAMDEVSVEHPDVGQLVFMASRALHPIESPEKRPKVLEPGMPGYDEAIEENRRRKRAEREAARAAREAAGAAEMEALREAMVRAGGRPHG
jgi:hypothetical protein